MHRAQLNIHGMKIGRFVLADRVHEKIKELILDQKFSPGMTLNINHLCRELAVSSSPLREALARLTAERLVQFEPFIGYSVAKMPDRQYYIDLMDLRLLLECHAARVGAGKNHASSVAKMEQAIRGMEKAASGSDDRSYPHYKAFHSWDAEFHMALVSSVGSQPLVEAYGGMHVHLHIARLYVVSGGFNTVVPVRDHRRILDAFKAGDPEAAEEAVRNHLCNIQVLKNWCGTYGGVTAPVKPAEGARANGHRDAREAL